MLWVIHLYCGLRLRARNMGNMGNMAQKAIFAMLRSAGARRLRKTLKRCPAGAKKNSPENCLVDLGRDARPSTQSRRLVRRKGASWSLNWPSGANLLAHIQLKCIPYVPL